MEFHEIANCWPMFTPEEMKKLEEDIAKQGQLDPITLYEGKVLDGRNRWVCCEKLGIKAKTETYKGKDPIAFAMAKNDHRRHSTESQRAIVAAKLEGLAWGQKKADTPTGISRKEAADMMNVGERTVARAARVLREAPEEVEAIVSRTSQGHLKEQPECPPST